MPFPPRSYASRARRQPAPPGASTGWPPPPLAPPGLPGFDGVVVPRQGAVRRVGRPQTPGRSPQMVGVLSPRPALALRPAPPLRRGAPLQAPGFKVTGPPPPSAFPRLLLQGGGFGSSGPWFPGLAQGRGQGRGRPAAEGPAPPVLPVAQSPSPPVSLTSIPGRRGSVRPSKSSSQFGAGGVSAACPSWVRPSPRAPGWGVSPSAMP